MYSVLYVDDEESLLEIGRLFLEQSGDFRIDTCPSAIDALEKIRCTAYDAIVSDYQMPRMNGIELLINVRSGSGDIPFILFTGRGREEVVIEAINNGADFYLQKGGDPHAQFAELAHKIRQAVTRKSAEALVREHYNELMKSQQELRYSEERYRLFVETAEEGFWAVDAGFVTTFTNRKMQEILGYNQSEMVGHPVWDFVLPDDKPDVQDILRERKGGKPGRYERRWLRKDGTIVWCLTSAAPLFSTNGTFTGSFGMFTDITERRQMEEALRESRELYRTVFETTGTAIIIVDENTTISLANTQFERLSGFTRQEIEGKKSWTEFAVPEDLDRMLFQHRARRTDPGKALQSYEFRFRNKAGEVRNIHLNINMIPGSTRSVASLMDITERKKAEESLCESEERLQLALDGGELGTWNWDVVTGSVIFSERWVEMLGYRLDEIEPHLRGWERLVHPDDMPRVQETLTAHLDGTTEYYECEHRLRHKSGSWIWVLDKGKVTMRDKAGRAILASGTHLDISRRKMAEEALRESEEKFRAIIENMQDIYYRSDAEGMLVMISPAGATILGYDSPSDVIGKNIADTLYYIPHDREQFLQELEKNGSVRNRITTLKKRDGSPFIISANCHFYTDKTGKILGVEGILHDITELKKTRDALAQANKNLSLLSSVTRHDSLNKLTILLSYLTLIENNSRDPALLTYLSKAADAGTSIRRQIEFTKVYEGLGLHDPQWEDLGRAVGLLPVPPGISVAAPGDSVEVLADPLLVKVFENLLDNSVRHGEKVTTVSVTCRESPDGLIVTYADDGTGIPPAEKEVIFERGYGKNTGLGLFLAREILAITGMKITETGVPGSGARFDIAVPKGSYRFAGKH